MLSARSIVDPSLVPPWQVHPPTNTPAFLLPVRTLQGKDSSPLPELSVIESLLEQYKSLLVQANDEVEGEQAACRQADGRFRARDSEAGACRGECGLSVRREHDRRHALLLLSAATLWHNLRRPAQAAVCGRRLAGGGAACAAAGLRDW